MDLSYDAFRRHGGRLVVEKERRPAHDSKQCQSRPPVAELVRQFQHDAMAKAREIASWPGSTLCSATATACRSVALLTQGLSDSLRAPPSPPRSREHEFLARRTRLEQELDGATCWRDYSSTARELVELQASQRWDQPERSEHFDEQCLNARLERLSKAQYFDDLPAMLRLVRTELTRDLGGMCDAGLQNKPNLLSKALIDRYIATVGELLDRILKACAMADPRLDKTNVELALKQTRQSYGRTALLLSGGGTLGMVHIGVIKALHEAGALPRVISGSSSGSIVAAVLGNTTDEELLPALEDFCHGDLAVFVGPHERQGWGARVEHFATHGCFFDAGNLRRVMVDLLGKTTFLEAYNRTRRILNITVSNSAEYESQPVLNYATAGNVTIFSAVVASCAVPFGFQPEKLLYKDPQTNNLIPWDPSAMHVDGSIDGDLPTNKLSAEFDVNHTIVSQVNPHVVPFLTSSYDDQRGEHRYWDTAAALARTEATRLIEIFAELPLLPRNFMTKISSVLGQRYSGDITLCPVDPICQFWTILENPTPQYMAQSSRQGERATWPMLDMIKTHLDIELLIDNAVRKVVEHVSFSESASDLRRLQLRRIRRSNRVMRDNKLRSRGRSHSHVRNSIVRSPDAQYVGPWPDQAKIRGQAIVLNHSPFEAVEDALISSAGSSSNSSSLDSGDESDTEENVLDLISLVPRISVLPSQIPIAQSRVVQSQPSTPPRGFINSPRSISPAPVPIKLAMTPVTPQRSSSPELVRTTPRRSSFLRSESGESQIVIQPRTSDYRNEQPAAPLQEASKTGKLAGAGKGLRRDTEPKGRNYKAQNRNV